MTINIYSPFEPHGSALIAVDEDTLKKLKTAIEQALETSQSDLTDFDSEGEEYVICVRVLPGIELHNFTPPRCEWEEFSEIEHFLH